MHERHQLDRAPVRRINDSAELTLGASLKRGEAVEIRVRNWRAAGTRSGSSGIEGSPFAVLIQRDDFSQR